MYPNEVMKTALKDDLSDYCNSQLCPTISGRSTAVYVFTVLFLDLVIQAAALQHKPTR